MMDTYEALEGKAFEVELACTSAGREFKRLVMNLTIVGGWSVSFCVRSSDDREALFGSLAGACREYDNRNPRDGRVVPKGGRK